MHAADPGGAGFQPRGLFVLRLITGIGLPGFTISAPFPIAAELMPAQHRRTYAAILSTRSMLASAFTLLPFVGFILADKAEAAPVLSGCRVASRCSWRRC